MAAEKRERRRSAPFGWILPRAGVLLDLDGRPGLLELALDRVGLVACNPLLDRLRRRVDEVLRLLQAEAGDRADDLDHLDLLLARAGEDDVERRLLLFGGCGAVAARRCARSRDRDRRGGGDPPLLLDAVLQLDELEHAHLPELLEHRVDCCHYWFPSSVCACVSVAWSVAAATDCVASAVGVCGSSGPPTLSVSSLAAA